MRILFLTQIIPYPPDAGPKVKTWHVLRYLAGQGHQVILASFIRPEEEPFVGELRKLCQQVHTVPIRRSRLADVGYWVRSHWSGRPFLVERDDLSAMRALVQKLVETEQIEAIHADQLTMAQFAFRPPQAAQWPMTVFDAHNAVWTIVSRTQETAFLPLKPVLALEARRIRKHEGQIVTQFDHTLAVSEIDKQALLQAIPEKTQREQAAAKITVIPIAVDTTTLAPTHRETGSTTIFTMGTLHYPPNADGIRWFLKEVFPQVQTQIPEVKLTITGKNPPADFVQAAQESDGAVRVTGYVPDLTPLFEESALMVVPVRVGGGMRVRILEAFARAMPVITTTVGLEGIEARPGIDVLVEDETEAFAAATVKLLQDSDLQKQLAENGRKLAENKYAWQAVLGKMAGIYGEA